MSYIDLDLDQNGKGHNCWVRYNCLIMILNILISHKANILYGVILALGLFLLKWLQVQLVVSNHLFEVYMGIIAISFTGFGIWLSHKLFTPNYKTPYIENAQQTLYAHIQLVEQNTVLQFDLSKRELEVLDLMAQGLSNAEIAEHLHVSLNTIKTHTSRLYVKMDVKRRTQAIDKAKKLNLLR